MKSELLSIAILVLMLCTSGAFLLHWKIKQVKTRKRITKNRSQCEPWFEQMWEDEG